LIPCSRSSARWPAPCRPRGMASWSVAMQLPLAPAHFQAARRLSSASHSPAEMFDSGGLGQPTLAAAMADMTATHPPRGREQSCAVQVSAHVRIPRNMVWWHCNDCFMTKEESDDDALQAPKESGAGLERHDVEMDVMLRCSACLSLRGGSTGAARLSPTCTCLLTHPPLRLAGHCQRHCARVLSLEIIR
jgi:hypothetical protein